MVYQLPIKNLLIAISLILLLCITQEHAVAQTCPPRHIGFDALGAKSIELHLYKKQKSLEAVTLDLSGTNVTDFNGGIPAPCLQMIEVSVDKDDKGKKNNEIFDLKISECSRNPSSEFGRILKMTGNLISKDPNAKNNIKKFSFNPHDKHTYLKDAHLKKLYSSNTLLESDGVDKINEILSKAECTLKMIKKTGNNLS